MSDVKVYDIEGLTLASAVALLEWRMIDRALYVTKGNLSRTASALDITRTTLRSKMKKHKISYQPSKETPA